MKESVLAPRGLTGSQPNISLSTNYVHIPLRSAATCDGASDALHDVIAATVMDELFVVGQYFESNGSNPIRLSTSISYFMFLRKNILIERK